MARVRSGINCSTSVNKRSNHKRPPRTRKITHTVYTVVARTDRRYFKNKKALQEVEGMISKR